MAIGTSGFQYPEWRGKFYPADLPTGRMLDFYTGRFDTVESNYSFRRVPSPKTIGNWLAKTPEGFRFSLKAPQRITYFAKLRDCAEQVSFFWSIVRELNDKLGAVLFQLPPTLQCDFDLLRDFIQMLPPGMRAAFEFRHESWFENRIFDLLENAGCAMCVAESADLATPRKSTANFGYLRLRCEDYSTAQLRNWAKWIQHQNWKDAFIYFKHEERAVGPKFAMTMQKILNCG